LNDNCHQFPFFKVRNPKQQNITEYGNIIFG
jgi:hypothetical protein